MSVVMIRNQSGPTWKISILQNPKSLQDAKSLRKIELCLMFTLYLTKITEELREEEACASSPHSSTVHKHLTFECRLD